MTAYDSIHAAEIDRSEVVTWWLSEPRRSQRWSWVHLKTWCRTVLRFHWAPMCSISGPFLFHLFHFLGILGFDSPMKLAKRNWLSDDVGWCWMLCSPKLTDFGSTNLSHSQISNQRKHSALFASGSTWSCCPQLTTAGEMEEAKLSTEATAVPIAAFEDQTLHLPQVNIPVVGCLSWCLHVLPCFRQDFQDVLHQFCIIVAKAPTVHFLRPSPGPRLPWHISWSSGHHPTGEYYID